MAREFALGKTLILMRQAQFDSWTPAVLDGGRAAFAEILRQIEQAQQRIEVRAFLWRDDEVGNRLARALLDAADRGVQVRILKDRVAAVYEYAGGTRQSFFHKQVNPVQGFQAWFLASVYRDPEAPPTFRQRINPLAVQMLAHPNISVSHARKRFDHSKLFVFDERCVILGSMGIGDNHHDEWVDVMVKVEGEQYVRRLRQRLAGEAGFDPRRRIDYLLYTHDSDYEGPCPMAWHRLELIESAEKSLIVEMAYFGDRRFTKALLRAVRRGVDVTLVTGEKADVLGHLNLATCHWLIRKTGNPRNLTVVLHPRNIHSKLVVADGRVADVGSANFTPISHGVYEEINLYTDDVGFANRLTETVQGHMAQGRIVQGRDVTYRKLYSFVEKAIVTYQGRRGG